MSLLAKLIGMQEPPVSSRRQFIFSTLRDIVEDFCLLYPFGLSQTLTSEGGKKKLNINSIQALRELDELLTEFDDYYLDNSEYGKALKTLFLQAPEPIKKKFEGYSKIKIENGEMLVPKSQNEVEGAIFEKFNDIITVNGVSPRLKLEYLLDGVPAVQLFRLHETIHFFQDDNSNYDQLFDMERKYRITGHYLKDFDLVIFVPSDQRRLDISKAFTKYTNPKVVYSEQLSLDELQLFFDDLINTEPWRGYFINGELGSVEQNIYDFFKKIHENEINRAILFEAQAYFVASPENILKAEVKTDDIAKYMIDHTDLKNCDHEQVRNAVDPISRAYASLLNSNIPDMEKHKIVAGIVGRNQFTYNPESRRYDGVEREVTELEQKYGKGSVSELDKERERQFRDIVNETLQLFRNFLAMKGYTHISILKTKTYQDYSLDLNNS